MRLIPRKRLAAFGFGPPHFLGILFAVVWEFITINALERPYAYPCFLFGLPFGCISRPLAGQAKAANELPPLPGGGIAVYDQQIPLGIGYKTSHDSNLLWHSYSRLAACPPNFRLNGGTYGICTRVRGFADRCVATPPRRLVRSVPDDYSVLLGRVISRASAAGSWNADPPPSWFPGRLYPARLWAAFR